MQIQLNAPGLGEHDPDNGAEHALVVPELEQYGLDAYVPNGAVIDVPDELAGSAPRWRRAKDGDDLKFGQVRQHAGHTEVYDLGSGLLAQTDLWSKPSVSNQEG